ncbi:MAG: OmpA family protein [Desulfobacteraceae bacterium]|nr:OmpA family protein [Desulfobacteraceae bacterium]
MQHPRFIVCLFAAMLLFASVIAVQAAPQADAAGCSDHPLFTRMTNMRITYCKTLPFDSFKFKTGKTTDTVVEGRRFEIKYQIQEGKEYPGPLAIIRNHQQAIAKIGGTTLYEDQRYTWLKVAQDGKEIWAQVDTAWGKGYMLTIIEKQAMAQEVVASAELFKTGLNTTGHVEVPGIFFDTGKSILKPESEAAVAEVAKLLKAEPGLKVYVVGHTDNTAALDLNLKLSRDRAEAVVQALATQHGIDQARLIGQGVGPLAPVASNDSEEGRAKNRRVELVKQ